ncbi:hypothetical protein Ade02nite_54680 [Paractinoplanes deccanensis]|uniref:Methyltransferase domain-containing protein n=1 Tax=Paractinoplanes deccanensis TaxID=113561 RepID=A0ABQ3YA43_9ACTN|nr:class I SAM-dependent methyltransferase [Actinoplanes deccanensis]GID76827.1 hypothetical protein Ade02nite_54680 [Actinoplanes deccanensis]
MTDAADFDALYTAATKPPWEIGAPQPALAELLDTGIRGPKVLDLGCGTGDLALALARRGHHVTGVDVSHTAVDTARAKATAAGLDIHFDVQDATTLTLTSGPFDTLIDSGLLHNLHRRGGTRATDYLRRLPELAAPGATVLVLAISHEPGQDWGLTPDYLNAAFAEPTWTGTHITRTRIHADVDNQQLLLPGLLLRTTKA